MDKREKSEGRSERGERTSVRGIAGSGKTRVTHVQPGRFSLRLLNAEDRPRLCSCFGRVAGEFAGAGNST